ncbi:MAG: prepilin-type N-terminal cleavage/methylation domain-containing protein [Anaeromyxobacter sp.]|nr:prepilin-type N-terminal cleavage/methylation domain-containing protein [Anaeromyxobacter sp.]MBL0275747.1 prepilin-type N-terminal cleavage/methylation domain-containing protein [Anaeromyxobacter sp.]
MRTTRRQRGATLIESMAALGILMIGATGMVALTHQSTFFMADSRRASRAASFGQDLVSQIELWDYTDPRLANVQTANDGDVGDSAYAFQGSQDPIADGLADHGEADLGADFAGLPDDLLRVNYDMQRYWNVTSLDDYNANGVPDGVRVAVIIRWRVGGANNAVSSWRRAVFMTMKINTADLR